jgi:hypothetical protein
MHSQSRLISEKFQHSGKFVNRETCEIRTPWAGHKNPLLEASLFQGVQTSQKISLGQDEVFHFTGCPYFTGLLFTDVTAVGVGLG